MRRRDFIARVGAAVVATPLVARAQQPVRMIGFLGTGSAAPYERYTSAMTDGLKSIGLIAGQNVAVAYRWADGAYERLPSLAAELVGRNAAVIVAAGGNAPAQAAMAAT